MYVAPRVSLTSQSVSVHIPKSTYWFPPKKTLRPAYLELVTGALDGFFLGTDGDGELGILGALGAEHQAGRGAGEREEGVHSLAAAEALRSLLEELLLLTGVAGGGVDAVHVPGASGGLHVGEVKVHRLVAVLGLGLEGGAVDSSKTYN